MKDSLVSHEVNIQSLVSVGGSDQMLTREGSISTFGLCLLPFLLFLPLLSSLLPRSLSLALVYLSMFQSVILVSPEPASRQIQPEKRERERKRERETNKPGIDLSV